MCHVSNSKKPLSITTKAMYYDKKGQVNVSAQRSFLKATELTFFSFQKFPSKQATRKGTGDKGEKNLH